MTTVSVASTKSMSHEAIYKPFGRMVAKRREALKLTQVNLAGRTGLSRASIASIESGRQNVLLHQVYALATALEMDKIVDLLPAQPKLEGGTMEISDETVTPRGKAQLNSIIEAALARRFPKDES
jgi:transcriptional regulator with XRE-family HTH domain